MIFSLKFSMLTAVAIVSVGALFHASAHILNKSEAPDEETPFSEAAIENLMGQRISSNYLGIQSQGDVEIEVLRIMCQPTELHSIQGGVPISWYPVVFGDASTLCLLTLRITNNADAVRQLYPDDGIPDQPNSAGGRVFFEFEDGETREATAIVTATGFEFYRGIIEPNTQYITANWIGADAAVTEIVTISYEVDPPLNEDGVSSGERYLFSFDVTNWEYSPLPEELSQFFSDWNTIP